MFSIFNYMNDQKHVGISCPEEELRKAERMIISSAPLDDFANIIDICVRRGWIKRNENASHPDPIFVATDAVKAWAEQIITTNAHFRQMFSLHLATGHNLDDEFAVMVLTEIISGQHGDPDLLTHILD